MTKPKLRTEDFYHQFHGHHHHNDPGNHVKPEWHKLNPKLEKRHKGLDLTAFRNAKGKVKGKVAMSKRIDTMRLEMVKKKKAK
jgi:hypothetical protein